MFAAVLWWLGHGLASLLRALLCGCIRLLRVLWPSPAQRRVALRAFVAAPLWLRVCVSALSLTLLWASTNWLYQVARKPSELLFPLDGRFAKRPQELWDAYQASFVANSTPLVTPSLLAALAYMESGGDPIARTYWRWQPSWNPLHWYNPASSAVGLYQLTDATFQEMKHYCIHDHRVVKAGPFYDPRTCWFNALYLRSSPSDAIELTAAYLDRQLRELLASTGVSHETSANRRRLAGVIHLCGVGAARSFVQQRFRVSPAQHCGSHALAQYLGRLDALDATFARLQRP